MTELLTPQIIYENGGIFGKYIGDFMKRISPNAFNGRGIRWHDPNRKDLQGEYFTAKTYTMRNAGYPVAGIPVNYQHGMHKDFGNLAIGFVRFADEDEFGLFIEGELRTREQYIEMLKEIGRKVDYKFTDNQLAQKSELMVKEVDNLVSTIPLQFSGGFDPSTWIVDPETKHIDQAGMIHLAFTPTPADDLNPIVRFKSAIDEVLKYEPTTIYSLPNQLTELPTVPTGDNGHKAVDGSADIETPIDSKAQDTKGRKAMSLEEMLALLRQLEEAMTAFGQQAGASEEDAAMMAEEVTDELGKAEDEEELKSLTAAAIGEKAFALFNAKLEKQRQNGNAAKAAFNSKANEHLKAQPATQTLPAFTGGNPRIRVGENLKYAHMSASDMALGILMRAAPFKSQGMPFQLGNVVSPDYLQAMASKMVSHADSMPYGKSAKSATQFDLAQKANYHLKSIMATKANELDASALAGQGDEWVGEFWSTDLWERERFARHYDTMVSKGMWVQTIERGAETAYFPTEGSDPVAYVAPQANSIDATGRPETTININPFGTGRVSITPAEIKIATSHTTILDEDSVINVVQTVNRQLNEAAMETRDKLMVNGDTQTSTTNINFDGSTPATGLQTPYYIASNGFRKTGLAAGRDASNVLNLAQYRLTLGQLDAELRQYYERMVFMIDPTTELASLAIAELATDDVRRTAATVTSGRLINIHGVDVLSNGFIPQTDTDGKVTGTGNIANRGTIMLVYAPYWGVAYKRNVTLETARDIYSGSNVYVLSMRIGFVPRGSNAAVASYNIATAAS